MSRFAPLVERRLPRTLVAVAGLFGTYGLMAGFGLQSQLEAVAFAPWLAMIGFDLGELLAVPFAVLAVGLWAAASLQGSSVHPTWTQALIRFAILGILGVGSGSVGRRLRESERSQRVVASLQSALIDSTLDGICLTDADGNVLISNKPLRKISTELGLPPTGTVPERLLGLADRMI